MALEALVTFKDETHAAIGRDRIRLLEAVARCGSISAGAREIGLSYKAAWDALDAMTNLFGQPLIEARAGGKRGGKTELTPAGLKVIDAYHRLEADIAKTLHALEPSLAETGINTSQLLTGFLMQTSARNSLRGTIANIAGDDLAAEVALQINNEITVYALLTAESVKRLGLVPGREAIALIKAPFVIIAPGTEEMAGSAHNCLAGTIARCHMGEVMSEVVVDIGDGRTIAATISTQSAKRLGLRDGMPVQAIFDAAHVLIAVV